ncbi:hypothetical protein A3B45_05310 [Candidatus Daviesbacteria bacterium RIFCSPLOWO2_01_FULL_39_12]|uniref:Uncharacterized protein n=1 Tax=Candidatus Daviesbacteria bacterium RIFCSPLOWO2_01_FULL_39_12 TaxID=1797785 RepID=A0A1F5KQ08_9BACT|nr:MAG: hypothetical protein A3D79_02615 [Candidatus Daviesbacteria bacterium RIFCSPHIGHO2_02_FULL_39_8]OGE43023.1 MAG: hypothetical protein A3B45_05310 [Candidatus Daviesbacteria bacterium RIFCSPLOWO2_01_FULL_39_12]
MAIQQTKKQSDIEKRLKLLRQSLDTTRDKQVYGRSEEKLDTAKSVNQNIQLQYPKSTSSVSIQSDITYFRHDLLKITSFATIAFGIQIVLYFLLRNNIIKLPF